MIKLVRTDYRLLHGQVAFAWTAHLGIDCILLVSDTLLDDPIRISSIKLAKPPGVKVVVKNVEESIQAIKSGTTDKYNLFVVCETVNGAVRLVEETGIQKLNLGGTKPGEGKREIGPVVFVSLEEEEKLKHLQAQGVYVYVQGLPEVKELDCKKILK
ncbi:MAG: PTS sugar transporter subunit IIB [Lachnospiraceae bacterium]|nr:PTS sugar transporter subunit IIB [Lachnospiraceae bacterium]